MPKTEQSNFEIDKPSPAVIALQKDLANKYRAHLLEEKKQQIKEFENFKKEVGEFANKLERIKSKFFEMYSSSNFIVGIENWTKRVKEIKSNANIIYSTNNIAGKKELALLDNCLQYLNNLLYNQDSSDEYDRSPATYCFNHYLTPLVNDFLVFNQSLNSHYNQCMDSIWAEFMPKCKLTKDKWNEASYLYDKSRIYDIDNNNCVRSITINKYKNKNKWSIELKALKTNADFNSETLYLSPQLNKQLADALNTNHLPITYPGIEYYPDEIDSRARVFKMNGTLEEINNIWPQILLTVIQLEGDRVFSQVPDIVNLFNMVQMNNANYYGRGPQENHPIWRNHPSSINNQMDAMSLKDTSGSHPIKPQRP